MDYEMIRRQLDASKSVDITSPSEEDTDSDIEDSSSNDAGQESSSNDEEAEDDSVAVESEGASKPSDDGDHGEISSGILNKERNNNKSKYPEWNGVKLYPPGGYRKPGTSATWNHGGFRKNEKGVIQKNVAVCGYCGEEITISGGSPTNLKKHLDKAHEDLVTEVEEKINLKQPKMLDFVKPPKPYSRDHPKQQQLRTDVTKWVINEKRPMDIVHDEGLRITISHVDSRLTLPSRNTLVNDITKLDKQKRGETKEKFKEIEYFASTNDAGTSLAGVTFIEINVHYVDENFVPQKKILDVISVDQKDHEAYRQYVDKSLRDFGIIHKTFVHTTDNEPTMGATFKRFERNGCFSHIQSKASSKALNSSKKLRQVRKKLRKITTKANKGKLKRAIQREQGKAGVKLRSVKQEISTRFTSTQIMFRSFVNDPNEKTNDSVDKEAAKKNFDAINAAMKPLMKKETFEKLKLDNSDLNVVANILPTLDILEEGISLIGGERYFTASLVLPFLKKFLVFLEGDEDDVIYVREFKLKMKEEMVRRCKENLNVEVLAKASFCDIRYNQLKFMDSLVTFGVTKLTKESIMERIKVELELLHDENSREVCVSKEPPRKKKKSFLDDDDNIASDGVRTVDQEMTEYLNEPCLKASGDPSSWLKTKQHSYPTISRMAKKFLAVQGTSTPSERAFSAMNNILTKKRLAMKDENFSKLMFLSDCVKY